MANKKNKLNKIILNALVDTTMLAGFALVYEPENTGLALHEWMGRGWGRTHQ